jgi:hypothetical protein
MKLKLGQLVNSAQALSKLIAQPMKIQYSFPLSRLAKAIEPELKLYDAARMRLLEEHGKLSDDKTRYTFEGEAAKTFECEIETLLAQEVEIDFKQITTDKLDRAEMSAADLALLDWLIVESVE